MKKLLLSSIIMFAVCGYATAQNATGSKFKKAEPTTTSAAPTPQKAAVTNDLSTTPVPASDKAAAKAAAATPAPTGKQALVKQNDVVGADGVVANDAAASKAETQKAEAAKAAAAKKNKQN